MIGGILNNFVNLGSGIGGTGKPKDNVERINDNVFIFNIFLNNGKSKIGLKFSAIEELNIVDDLRYFFTYGTMTINYNNDVLESFESIGGELGGSKKDSEPYQFRGDGRDILEIEIMPQLKEQKCLEVYANESERRKYCIKHTCIIYKYEDLSAGKGEKKRKLYFWERDYQLLREVNINYSTCDSNKNKVSSIKGTAGTNISVSKSNTDCSIFTGDAIEGVLKSALATTAKSRFSKGAWDKGGSKIFYSSSGVNKALDDLNYVLSYHISDSTNKFLPCILKKERYTGKYNLTPLNKFYSSSLSIGGLGGFLTSGPQVIEDFLIGKMEASGGMKGLGGAGLRNKK